MLFDVGCFVLDAAHVSLPSREEDSTRCWLINLGQSGYILALPISGSRDGSCLFGCWSASTELAAEFVDKEEYKQKLQASTGDGELLAAPDRDRVQLAKEQEKKG